MTTLTPTDQQLHACTATATGTTLVPVRIAEPVRVGPAALVALGDIAAVLAAVLVSGAPLWAIVLVPATLTALSARGQYRPRVTSALDALAGVVLSATFAAGLLMLATAALAPAALPAGALGQAWLLSCGLLVAARGATLAARRSEPGVPTVILGTGEQAAELHRILAARPADGMRPVAHIDIDLADPQLDDHRGLASMAREAGGLEVVIVPGDASDASIGALARACAEQGLGVAVRTAVGESGRALTVDQAGPVALVRLEAAIAASDWRLALKHGADRLVAAFALFCMAPVLLGLALAVRLSSSGPVLFRQRRVGRDGREFDMLKFRSMRAEVTADAPRSLRAGAAPGGVEGVTDRRTAIGSLLRRTSLDELPQLLNVARGEMSLVGPRPERPEFVDRFSVSIDRYSERHRLKSGMTGLAQINGLRGRTSIRDRIAYDNHYVEHWNPWLDVKILLATVRAVFDPAE